MTATWMAWILVGLAAAEDPAPRLFRGVALAGDTVVFSSAGDLWRVSAGGGPCERLTATGDDEIYPLLSRDGRRLAFARESGGNVDVYVRSLEDGAERRLTFHPAVDLPRDWSPDGSRLLFASLRDSSSRARLYEAPAGGGFPQALPLPWGHQGVYSPDGGRLAYLPRSIPYEFMEWRYYRGGAVSPLWILDLARGTVEQRIPGEGNHRDPFWVGDRLYYLSDESGTFQLYSCDLQAGTAECLTSAAGEGLRSMATDGALAVYEQDGKLHVLDLASRTDVVLPLEMPRDPELPGRRSAPPSGFVQSLHLGPGGRCAVETRGEILLVEPEGETANVTQSPGIAEREPALSPDGASLAYFSDETGEYELVLASADGGDAFAIPVEDEPTYYRELTWSPTGEFLAFSDTRLGLWLVHVSDEEVERIDCSSYIAQGRFRPAWSPDGRWLAYEKADGRGLRTIYLHDTEEDAGVAVTDGRTHCESPVFDRSGRYLYFLSSQNARQAAASDVNWALLSTILAEPLLTRSVQAVVLQDDAPPPFLPASPRPHPDVDWSAQPSRIDVEGLERRIVPLPLPPRDYQELWAGPPGVLYATEQAWSSTPGTGGRRRALLRADLAAGGTWQELQPEVDLVAVGPGGERVLVGSGPSFSVLSNPGSPRPETTPLFLDSRPLEIDVAEEWRQMYHETWRMMRDYFYDPGHHGLDVAALEEFYAGYLPSLTRRADLNDLFRRMLGHLSVSHLRVGGGDDLPGPVDLAPAAGSPGLLGADFTLENGRYRFARILRNGHFAEADDALRAPLDQPGVDVQEGEYLLAIDGEDLAGTANLYEVMIGHAFVPTRLRVGPDPEGSGSREVLVTPVADTTALSTANWAEANRRRVEEASGGRLGYVSVADFGSGGVQSFLRQYLGQQDREGLVIDVRFNGGGITVDALVDLLLQRPWYRYAYRNGDGFPVPPGATEGPRTLIVDETNGSAAETFALMFQVAGVGTVVGRPTLGGGIGSALFQQRLVDGGRIGIPNRAAFNPAGSWDIENTGVAPDLLVEILPEHWRQGRDPQLETAIQHTLAQLEGFERSEVHVPPYPVHPTAED